MPSTLVDVLRAAAARLGDRPAFTYLRDGEYNAETWSFAELERRSLAVAAALQGRVKPGQRVLLLYPQGLEYIAALLGSMAAGVLAVPLQPPGRHRAKLALPKLEAIAADGGVALACTLRGMVGDMTALVAGSPALGEVAWLATDEVDPNGAAAWVDPGLTAGDLAYLQYTSGSTSTPKGVMVSHANLLYNLSDFHDGFGHDADSVMVSWLPTFHDLGLVYGVFMPLYVGFHGVLLDPLQFLSRPLRWLEAIARYRGTHAPAPNFAFELCAVKSTPEERARLDLRSWKVALNGAEPIRYESEAAFVEAFAASGVSWATLSHAYGMSEATACISKEWLGTPRVWLDVDGKALDQHRVVRVAPGAPGARRIAGCGRTSNQTVVRVARADTTTPADDGEVGELWVGGPTRAEGYWNQPEASEEAFRAVFSDGDGPYLRTGDLGFVADGQVFVTGRLKDLIILHGENFYPQDLELSVEKAHAAVRPSCVAAFAIEVDGEEGLAVVAEAYPEQADEAVIAAIRDAIADHGVQAHTVALVRPRSIHKTSSGKIMRRRTRESLLEGSLELLMAWTRPAAEARPRVDVVAALADAPAGARVELLAEHVLSRAGELLGLPADALDADTPLKELGFDSVQAVELADRLAADLGRDVPVTALFEQPTARALAAWLLPAAPVAAAPAPRGPAPVDDDLDGDLAELLRRELEDL
jgi:acyl-CoA synthetase (AMP-forming)/AMP-acid ligase II/aryl carrier-like protein